MKISIITINFNNKDGIEKTISSVVAQTYKDIQYIIIDGDSTDGSVEVIKKYHEDIDYWISEPDKGIYDAMNKGILKATGDYVLFLNSGDYLSIEELLTNEQLRNCYQEYLKQHITDNSSEVNKLYALFDK